MRKIVITVLLITSSQAFTQSFISVVNQLIPDDGTSIEFEMEVTGLPDVIDTLFGLESVCLNINHTWDSDLDVRLIAPDGTSTLLFSGVGWGAVNFTYTCLNEGADDFIYEGSAPYTGEWIPMGDMGVLNNGQNPNGTWKLLILDTWPFADQGYMINWILTFGDEPALPFPFYSSNLPIVKINTGGQVIQNEPKTNCDIYFIDHGPGILNHPTDTDYAYIGNILVELQGFTGPYYPKKNYDFDLVDNTGLEIDTVLLGLPSENDFILKAEYLDYSLMKNMLSYELSRRMGRYAPRTKFCELIIDGEYMGVYTLTEKVKRDHNRVDIAQLDSADVAGEELTGGYIIEINENYTPNDWESDYLPINYATCGLPVAYKMVTPRIEEIQPEQLDYIIAYIDSFEDALHGDDFLDSVKGYRNYISVKSFIDFMIVNEFSANYDSYGRSTYLFKDKNGQLNIGPPWDYDRAYAPWTVEGWVWEITHPAWPFPFWWDQFREDEEWRNEVYCRYTSLRENILSADSFHAIVDSCYELIHDAAGRNFVKWSELYVSDYDYYVDELNQFIDDRLSWMDEAMEENFVPPPDASFTAGELTPADFLFTPVQTNGDYLWEFGDGTTSAEQNPVHTYDEPGAYTVTLTVTYFYGCNASSTNTIDVIAGIPDAGNRVAEVFPNPFTDHLDIRLPQSVNVLTLVIYNNLDQEIARGQYTNVQSVSLGLPLAPPGAYLMRVEADGETGYVKLVKL